MKMEIRPCRLAELLTTELLIQILIRLPLESVLVCRGVCKSWNNLILQPLFADLHRSSSPPPLTITVVHPSFRRRRRHEPTNFELVTEKSSFGFSLAHKVTQLISQVADRVCIVGSCNGLICLSFHGDYSKSQNSQSSYFNCYRLVLCNPVLRSHFYLPDPPQATSITTSAQLGFGYVSSTRQYKAVKIVYMKAERQLLFHVCTIQSGGGSDEMGIKLHLCPPSTSAWRTICYDVDDGLPLLCDDYSYPTFFKGSIIWVAESENEAECQVLVCFDVEKEQVQTLALPPTIFTDYETISLCDFDTVVRIGVYCDDEGKDHLYLCEERRCFANIWVMEDYQSIDSLELKWVIQLPLDGALPLHLFKVLKDGKLVVGIQNSILAYYDPNTRVLETMENLQFPVSSSLAVDTPNLLGCLL